MDTDIYTTMIEKDEAWLVYADGCALYLGVINTAVAMDC